MSSALCPKQLGSAAWQRQTAAERNDTQKPPSPAVVTRAWLARGCGEGSDRGAEACLMWKGQASMALESDEEENLE